MATVCNNQVVCVFRNLVFGHRTCSFLYIFTEALAKSRDILQFYGIWGDTNGFTSTGDASLALSEFCFPQSHLLGDNSHGPNDVFYIGFAGSHAVPGENGANWKAKNTTRLEASIKSLGDKLVASL